LETQRPDGTFTSIYLHPGGKGNLLYEKEIRQSDGRLQHKHYVQAGALLVGVYVTQSSYATGEAPGMRYYHLDHLGSIALITNESAGVMERLAYEAFGERRYPSGTPEDRSSPLFGITTDRGFTGHEQLDELMLIHMYGLVYDSLLGRFTTPDPFIQAPSNLQSYNRYSYVWNNPLGAIDPTGFSWWTDIRDSVEDFFVAQVRATFMPTPKNEFDMVHSTPGMHYVDNFVLTHPWAYQLGEIAASSWGGAVGAAMFAAYYGYEGTGSINAGLRAGAISLATAWAYYEVGTFTNGHNIGSDYFLTGEHIANIAGHAAVGCASSAASGGDCRAGAFSGAAGSFVTPLASNLPSDLSRVGGLVSASVIGGTASVIGGGSFANGAKTAAFGYLFNQAGRQRELNDEELAQVHKGMDRDLHLAGIGAHIGHFGLLFAPPPFDLLSVPLAGVGFALDISPVRTGYAEIFTRNVDEQIRSTIQDLNNIYGNQAINNCGGCFGPGIK